MLRLITLGRIELTDARGRPIESILTRPKRLALLTYLAMAGEGKLRSRDTVLGLFWPEHGQSQARSSLNQALYVLRRALGKDVVVSIGNDQIGIAAGGLWCDAVALRAAVASGDHRSAQAHYRGEFLPGFFLSDAAGFERWLDAERATLQRMASSSAWKLATEAAAAGDVDAAAEAAVRSAELSLSEESAVRRAIELLDGLGERARALDLYRALETTLAEDLETTPSPETQAVVAQVRSRQPPDDVARAAAAGGRGAAGTTAMDDDGGAEPREDLTWRYEPAASDAPATDPPGATPARVSRRQLGALVGVAAAMLGIALSIAWALLRTPSTAAADIASSPHLLIEPFSAHASDDRLTDIAGAITAGLAARLAEVEALDVLLVEEGGSPSADSAALAHENPPAGRAWFIVRGRVLRDGDRMRAVVSLIDRRSGQVIGSATIERVTSDPIAFVDVATAEASLFTRAAVGRELRERTWRASTRNREAWELLERAEADRRRASDLRDDGAAAAGHTSLEQADSLLALAEREAPEWVIPIVVRAQVAHDRMWSFLTPPSFDAATARRYAAEGVLHADRALARDSSEARAHELKGILLYWRVMLEPMSTDSAMALLRRAEVELRAAVAQDPMRAQAWSILSAMLYQFGRFDESYYAAKRAYEEDAFLDHPQDILVKLFNGAFEAGDEAAARDWCMQLRQEAPVGTTGAICALSLLAWTDSSADAGSEARRIRQRTALPAGHQLAPHLDLLLAIALARVGEADSALAILRRTHASGVIDAQLLVLEASLRLTLDQPDSAAALLREYIDEKPSTRQGVLLSRRFDSLRE